MSTHQPLLLLVDDNPADLDMYREVLAADYRLLEAETGTQALVMVREHRPDALLLDYRLPGMDGLAVLEKIRAETDPHTIAIVMLTGTTDRLIGVQAIKAGAQDFIAKDDFTPDSLRRTVVHALAANRFKRDLARQREWFAVTLRSIGDAVIATDIQGKVTFMNTVAEEVTGWTEVAAQGQPVETVFRIIDEVTRLPVENPVQKVLEEGHAVDLPNPNTLLLAKDGREIPIDDSGAPIHDKGNLIGVVLVFRDITQRKRAEAASEASRLAYAQLVNQLPQLVWTCTPEGVCDFLNERWVQFTGIPAEKQLGQAWLEQIHPDDRVDVMNQWTTAVAEGSNFNTSYRIRRYDGAYHWFDTRANPLHDETGRITKWFGSSTDIQLTHDLTNQLAQQAALLDLSLEPILAWSPAGGIEFWNKGCEQCYGYSASEAIGQTSHTLLQTRMPEAEPWYIDTLLLQGTWSGELIHTTQRGEVLTVLSRMQVVQYEGRHLVLESNRDITARKKSEDALRIWAETFERAGFAVAITDAVTDTFSAVNPTYAHERGYTPEELVGQSVYSIYAPDRLAESQQLVAEIDRVSHGTFETDHLAKDGRRLPVMMDITVLKDRRGRPQTRIACALDIRERKVAEAALQASEARLKLFIEHAPAALAMFDRNMCYMAASRRWLTDYGIDNQEVLSRSHYALFPDIPERWRVVHRRALAGEVVRHEEDRFVRADGSEQWIRWETRPWYAEMDDIGGIVIFAEDITERKRAVLALADSEFQHRTLLNAIQDGVFVAQDQRLVFANCALPNQLGYEQAELIGSSFERIIAPHFLPFWRQKVAVRINNAAETTQPVELCVCRKDGSEIWVELRASPTSFNGKTALLGILHDISERKRSEEEIRALNLNLEQRVKERTGELQAANQELETFAYAVTHDLRAPLRAMQGFSHALIEDYGSKLNNEARAHLEQIRMAGSHMAELIEGLLALARSTRGDLVRSQVDLTLLAEHVVDELRRIEPDRQVSLEVEPGLSAYGDPHMLELVLRNLLGNAWKYTSKVAHARIRVYAEERDSGVSFCVADNGAGFEMAHAEKLFQPFQRLHRQDEYPGIGIGLATVERIIHRHGGRIWANSRPGQGAAFYFQVPQYKTAG